MTFSQGLHRSFLKRIHRQNFLVGCGPYHATFQPDFTITNRITAGLTRIERARGFLEAAMLSEDWLRELGNRALVLEARHTTHIEGTRLTLDQAERLWQDDSEPEADPDDAGELLNYRKAFDFVSEYLKSGGPIFRDENSQDVNQSRTRKHERSDLPI